MEERIKSFVIQAKESYTQYLLIVIAARIIRRHRKEFSTLEIIGLDG